MFMRVGGVVSIRPTFPVWRAYYSNARLMLTQPYSHVIFDGNILQGTFFLVDHPVGTFGAGARLSFSLSFYSLPVVREFSQSDISDELGLRSQSGSVAFGDGFYSFRLGYTPDLSMVVDWRREAGPPREMQPLIVPRDGQLLVRYLPESNTERDALWVHWQGDSLLVDRNLPWGIYPKVNVGMFSAGDTVRFSLISGVERTAGERMYPRVTFDPFGDILYWRLEFEDWIDADFRDVFGQVLLEPPRYKISFEKETASPGDTVRLFIESIGEATDPYEEMDTNIIEGSSVAILQDTLGNTFGKDMFYRPFSNVQNGLRLLIRSDAPIQQRIILQVFRSWSMRYSGRAEFKIEKKAAELDHFAVTVSPDTIEHNATATITVQAKDRNNNDIELASGTKVNVALRADEKYGTLTYAGRTGKTIDDIPYEDAKLGKVKFVADGENPIGLEPQKVDVGVTGSGKEGRGKVWVIGTLDYTHFKQMDSPWGNHKYDEYIDTVIVQQSGKRDTVYYKIRRKGCAVTAMAMVLKAFGVDADPGSLNKWMNENKGFDVYSVVWESVDRYPGNNKVEYNTMVGKGYRKGEKNQLGEMDAFLVKGLPVLAEVFNPSTNSQHWVLVTGKRGGQYKIFDPGGYANRNTLEEAYKNTVYRFIVYTPKR